MDFTLLLYYVISAHIAQYMMGANYELGSTPIIEKNLDKVMKCYNKCHKLENYDAAYRLGLLLYQEKVKPKKLSSTILMPLMLELD
jgi:hypothetical protein